MERASCKQVPLAWAGTGSSRYPGWVSGEKEEFLFCVQPWTPAIAKTRASPNFAVPFMSGRPLGGPVQPPCWNLEHYRAGGAGAENSPLPPST